MKTNNTTFSSRIKIAIVIGIASAGLIGSYLAILNYNGWSSFKPKLPLDERRIEILNATRQMPEVQAFVTRYPDATSNVTLTDYTYTGRGYTPQEANLTVAEAVVTYTAKENYPAQHFQIQPKLELYLRNSSAPYLQQPYTAANVTKPPSDGYYYSAISQCHIEALGSDGGGIVGFPKGTFVAEVNRDCSQVEHLTTPSS